jgi:competence protein ComEA
VIAWLQQNPKYVIVALVAALAAAGVWIAVDSRDGPDPLEVRPADATPQSIQVYITGAVLRPGVYEMAEGERVIDVLTKAGGFAGDANPEAAPLAQRLHDEATIVIPRLNQPGQASGSSQVAGSTSTGGPVNINSASQDELIALPGIGEAYSQRIIDSRSSDGPFTSTDELLARAIIPQRTYDEIKDLIIAQ